MATEHTCIRPVFWGIFNKDFVNQVFCLRFNATLRNSLLALFLVKCSRGLDGSRYPVFWETPKSFRTKNRLWTCPNTVSWEFVSCFCPSLPSTVMPYLLWRWHPAQDGHFLSRAFGSIACCLAACNLRNILQSWTHVATLQEIRTLSPSMPFPRFPAIILPPTLVLQNCGKLNH